MGTRTTNLGDTMIQNRALLIAKALFDNGELLDIMNAKTQINPEVVDEKTFLLAFACGTEFAISALLASLSDELVDRMDSELDLLHDMLCPKCDLTPTELADAQKDTPVVMEAFLSVTKRRYEKGQEMPPGLEELIQRLFGGVPIMKGPSTEQ